ncbi:MAG: hypothetical protein KatS3mg081_0596 [Gemmatimonadales bacterium]|nr:MAG: hypothetical protein KatS3mg081_0596 [Gemmatimonadales bacterium]
MRTKIKVNVRGRKTFPPFPQIGNLSQNEVWELLYGWPGGFEREELARAMYAKHRDELIAAMSLGHRPSAFWKFEDGIPDELRRERVYEEEFASYDAMILAEEKLQCDRAKFLLEHPELWRPGENREIFTEMITIREQNIDSLEREAGK